MTMNDFFKYVEPAVTVCDTECVIVYQNEKSVAVNGDMRGKCMLGCHNDRSRGPLRGSLQLVHHQ